MSKMDENRMPGTLEEALDEIGGLALDIRRYEQFLQVLATDDRCTPHLAASKLELVQWLDAQAERLLLGDAALCPDCGKTVHLGECEEEA